MVVQSHPFYQHDIMPPTIKPKSTTTAASVSVLANEMSHVKEDVTDIKQVLKDMSAHLGGISRIEERQMNVVAALQRGEDAFLDHGKRITAIEVKVPQWDEMRADVRRGIRAGVGMLAAGIIALTLNGMADRFFPKTQQTQIPQLSQVPQLPQSHQ